MGIGWAQKLWDGGVADPLEIRPPHMCYRAICVYLDGDPPENGLCFSRSHNKVFGTNTDRSDTCDFLN